MKNLVIKYLFIFLFNLLIIGEAMAQLPSLYSQYMFNGLAVNPAYAGSAEALSVTALARKQWTGVDGAPTGATFSAHAPVRKDKMALGLLLNNNHVSIFDQTSISAVYAYRILFSETARLSLGLQAGLTSYSAKYSKLTAKDPNDPSLAGADYTSITPNFGTGVYFSNRKFYAGLSVPSITSNLVKTKYVVNDLALRNVYLLTAGYVITLSNDFKLKPSALLKYVSGSPLQLDLNTNVLFREVLWLGVSYRTSNALSFIVQVNATDQFRVGYAYDHNIGSYSLLQSNSHEVMINYIFSYRKTKVVTPRYF
jgi:type IX secretion system PorP/SprF family membrane protein